MGPGLLLGRTAARGHGRGKKLPLPSCPAGIASGTSSPLICSAFRCSRQSDAQLTGDGLHAHEAGWWRPGSDGAGSGRGEWGGTARHGAPLGAGLLLGAAVGPSNPGGMGRDASPSAS